MIWLLALPVAIPFAAATLAMLARERPMGRWISLAGSALHLAASIWLVATVAERGMISGQMGMWPAPFGITLVADHLSAAMVLVASVTGLAVAIYGLGEVRHPEARLGHHALFQLLMAGVTGAFVTGDLFNLYVWFEVMLIASFGLLVLGGRRAQIDGAIRYVALNLVSTILFLSGIGLLYGMTGTLNMADLNGAVAQVENEGLVRLVACLFLVAFGIKAAVFPLFFWLPASYHTPAFAVSAVFAGLLTKVGVYALIRSFTLIFPPDPFIQQLLLWCAGATMLSGVLGAAAQSGFRKILSFHIVSQIGYMILGLALMTPFALAGAAFYLAHHIVVKANLFLVAGVAARLQGHEDVYRVGGLYRSAPLLGALFLVPAFSLAGFPPLSGFWAKLVLVRASLEQEYWWLAAAALITGALTIYSMTKIWAEAFWKGHPDGTEPVLTSIPRPERLALLLPIAALAAVTVLIGLVPAPLWNFAVVAGDQLMNPAGYVAQVLGETS